jgi:hypothetical protein
MTDHLTQLSEHVQMTADWRRRKAAEFPDDTRNLEAAEELKRLATEIEKLEGSPLHRQISELNDKVEEWHDIMEQVNEELRQGFHGSYDTGAEFVEWYRDLLIDEASPAPDLEEQAANDPAVKAAKQIYDDAYTKALTEARKKTL